MAQTAKEKSEAATRTLTGMTARWSDPHRLLAPPTGYVRAVNHPQAR